VTLSEQLKQDHECGDFGKALEGYSDRAAELENIIQRCFEDACSSTGKISKKTALLLMTVADTRA